MKDKIKAKKKKRQNIPLIAKLGNPKDLKEKEREKLE